MSIDNETALASGWPIEVTEFAYIGDQVARDLNQLDLFDPPLDEMHFGAFVWTIGSEDVPLFSLVGCADPGGIWAHLSRVSDRVHREFASIYAEAGFFPDPRNNNPIQTCEFDRQTGIPVMNKPVWHPPLVRPCVGDPRMDPTVLEEGCMVPWLSPATFYGIEDRETEDQGVEPNVPGFTRDDILRTALETGQTTVQVRTSLRKVLDFIDGAVPGNEPADHDSYIDYLFGKTPGLDGVTYVDGSRNEETDG